MSTNQKELLEALEVLEEKGISKTYMIEALQLALETAYKKNFNSSENVKVDIDEETGSIKVYAQKTVVEEVTDPYLEISFDDAKQISKMVEIGSILDIEVTPRDFGRIAAQTGKHVVIQKIREAERDYVYNLYADKKGEVVVGLIQKNEKGNVIVDLGKVEALLPMNEQIASERLIPNHRLKAFVLDVHKGIKGGPQIILSRSTPYFVKKLFEIEIPEIGEGLIEIKGIMREAGSRTKIAVISNDENVDPIGSCVGKKGIRIQSIIQELNGEKIDIIPFSDDPKVYIPNALSPAKVLAIDINENDKTAKVVVPDDQLSLAIGKEGQNVRLAANLTGWKIDIKSETQIKNIILE